MDKICPCSNQPYKDCCEPYHKGTKTPDTPEKLMRSRYSAFALKDVDYLEKTMTGPALQGFNRESTIEALKEVTYEKLEVIETDYEENKGIVEFKAYYSLGDQQFCLHERSIFIKKDDKWLYYDGQY